MKDSKFVMHHIGGRAGTRSFPRVSTLEHEFISVMYEASSDGNDQIIQVGNRLGTGQTILVNACVGKSGSTRLFNLNRDPYTSSLLSLDPKYEKYYMQADGFDYTMGEAISLVRQEIMYTESLDELILSHALPTCDFLSIDTQGSELEILQNCFSTLENCVGIQVEVAFVQRYKDQPLFGEIDALLKQHGFEFIRFRKFGEWAPLVTGVECRGEKMQVESDAIYFKSSQRLKPDQFYPSIFTALAFGQTEFALQTAVSNGFQSNVSNKSEWMIFCDSFLTIANKNDFERPTFSQKYSIDKSFERFLVCTPSRLRFREPIGVLRKVFWSVPLPIKSVMQKFEARLRKQVSKRRLRKLVPTEIEILFEGVGLAAVVAAFRRSRCS